eukprot:3128198-Rhodomonas_salina.3
MCCTGQRFDEVVGGGEKKLSAGLLEDVVLAIAEQREGAEQQQAAEELADLLQLKEEFRTQQREREDEALARALAAEEMTAAQTEAAESAARRRRAEATRSEEATAPRPRAQHPRSAAGSSNTANSGGRRRDADTA